MAFLCLPNEIAIEIVEYLQDQRDINSVSRFRGTSALFWAANNGQKSTASMLLHLGADVNIKLQKTPAPSIQQKPSSAEKTGAQHGITPLYLAAGNGHLDIVKMLLEIRANPNARTPGSQTPLYAALSSRHEKIARTISRRIRNPQHYLVDSEEKLTPLHVASRFGLSNSVRYFLERGADINAGDKSGKTPLYHALDFDYHFPEFLNHSIRHKWNNAVVPDPDQILETVKVLLESGANPDIETMVGSIWSKPITARGLGLRHRDERVRALFNSMCSYKPSHVQIGRKWMLPSSSGINESGNDEPGLATYINNETISRNQYHFEEPTRLSALYRQDPDDVQWLPSVADVKSFPILSNAITSNISNLQMHLPNDTWSSSNINRLLAGFSFNEEPEITPKSEPTIQVDPFPLLINDDSRNLGDGNASKFWANLGKPGNDSVAEDIFTNFNNGENTPALGSKGKKARGKTRWQPLKL